MYPHLYDPPAYPYILIDIITREEVKSRDKSRVEQNPTYLKPHLWDGEEWSEDQERWVKVGPFRAALFAAAHNLEIYNENS
jgi:hypothetical protein